MGRARSASSPSTDKPASRLLAVLVVLVIAAAAVVGAFFTRRAVRSEEQQLLRERASELGLILTGAYSSLQTALATAAAETALNGADPQAFRAAVSAAVVLPRGATIALADTTTEPATFLATVGTGLPATALGDREALIRRALVVQPVAVTTVVFDQASAHLIGLAYRVGAGSLVLYEELPLSPVAAGRASAQGQPFRELAVALYAAPTQDPSTLVVTTGGAVPLRGSVALARTTFGADTWLVAIKATTPLVGSFAANAYWLVLGAGLVVAVAIGAMVESLRRRRDYALALVGERTAELNESVAELNAAQDQLVRQTRLAAIGQLAAAVGHELRNPLGVITNAHYLLRAGLEQQDNEKLLRQLGTAEREVGAASLIVGDLLDFARARDPVTAPVDLPDLLDEVLGVVSPPAGVTVSRDEAPGLPPALADRDQVRQILLNLITNAYEAMPNGGTVTVSIAATGDSVRVTVADGGVGMDQETAARAFEPFFTRKARGIGLGLAVSKRIVEAHGGTIAVTSKPGEGSVFTVDLPVASAGAGR